MRRTLVHERIIKNGIADDKELVPNLFVNMIPLVNKSGGVELAISRLWHQPTPCITFVIGQNKGRENDSIINCRRAWYSLIPVLQ